MTIRIDFDRIAEHATYGGFRTRGADPYFDMCRVLVSEGVPDDAAVFIDERGMPCLETRSFHACARRYRPTDAEKIEQAERVRLRRVGEAEYKSWWLG